MTVKCRLTVTFGQNWLIQQSHGLLATAKLLILLWYVVAALAKADNSSAFDRTLYTLISCCLTTLDDEHCRKREAYTRLSCCHLSMIHYVLTPPVICYTDRWVGYYVLTMRLACNATHGIAKAFMPVCPCLSFCQTCIVTKRKKLVRCPHSYTLHHMKDHSTKKNGWWGNPFYLKFWAKLALLQRKRRFSIDIRS